MLKSKRGVSVWGPQTPQEVNTNHAGRICLAHFVLITIRWLQLSFQVFLNPFQFMGNQIQSIHCANFCSAVLLATLIRHRISIGWSLSLKSITRIFHLISEMNNSSNWRLKTSSLNRFEFLFWGQATIRRNRCCRSPSFVEIIEIFTYFVRSFQRDVFKKVLETCSS